MKHTEPELSIFMRHYLGGMKDGTTSKGSMGKSAI